MQADLDRVLIDRDRIARRIDELGADIADELSRLDGDVVLVAVLTGSVVFLADLIRRIPCKLRIETVDINSYPGRSTESRGPTLRWSGELDLEGRHVLILDDILDSGGTLRLLREQIGLQRPASLRACVLLRKDRPSARRTPCEYVGFDIPDVFVVGYGLDYNSFYRNLPDIATLRGDAL